VRASGAPVRVILAEDSVLLREGIARLLADNGFDVVGSCDNGDTLLRLVGEHQPDVVVVDVRMPPSHTDEGLRAAHSIRTRWPQVGVVVLSQYVEVLLASRLLARGPNGIGYLLKDRIGHVEEFAAAVRRVGEGGSSLDPTVVSQLFARRQTNNDLKRLTSREREVLGLMAEGLSNYAVAAKLVISVRAVEKHVTAIFDKLGLPVTNDAHRRVLAVLAFLRS
jgi:DNA-binding NarL/FixJ family response regulator